MSEEKSTLRRGPSPRLGERRSTLRRGPSPRLGEIRLRRLAEVALIGIAAVWGLTFVMVQDAIALLPTMAFLAYRFIPAALIVALIFWRPLRELPAAGWRAGLLMGVFLAGGYIFQTLGLEETSASNTGFITGLFVVLTPVLGAVFLGHRISTTAWVAAGVAMLGLWLLVRRRRRLRPARRRPGAAVRVLAGGAHPRDGRRRAALRRRRPARRAARRGRVRLARDRGGGRPARAARGGDRLVGPDRDVARGELRSASSCSPSPRSTRRPLARR